MSKLSPYAKAITGLLFGAVTAYLYAKDNGVNGDEWLQILVSALAGSGLVYAVPNKDPQARHQQDSVQPPQRGQVDLGLALLVVITIGVVLLLFGVRFK